MACTSTSIERGLQPGHPAARQVNSTDSTGLPSVENEKYPTKRRFIHGYGPHTGAKLFSCLTTFMERKEPTMKINANPMASFNREMPKASPALRAERTDKPAPSESGKTAPPGLERALSRLQNMEASERTAGQTNAMDKIGRNLARYIENQAIGVAPAPEAPSTPVQEVVPSPTDAALAPAPGPTEVSVEEPVVSDTEETPVPQMPEEMALVEDLLASAADPVEGTA
jgi:hypothetical protein